MQQRNLVTIVFLSMAAEEKHEELKTQNDKRLHVSINKFLTPAFLFINIDLSKF